MKKLTLITYLTIAFCFLFFKTGNAADGGIDSLTGIRVDTPRGFEINKAYTSDSEIDSVDTGSGNLVVQIPIGNSYSVGPLIDYGLVATYNNNSWDSYQMTECTGNAGCTTPNKLLSVPSQTANAGLGWEVHFGQLYAPLTEVSGLSAPERQTWPNRTSGFNLNAWLYVAPDGSQTFLDNDSTSGLGFYSQGGSHIRKHRINSNLIEVKHPNGLVRVFERATSAAGTICRDVNFSACWRISQIKDSSDNVVNIKYGTQGTKETWTVEYNTPDAAGGKRQTHMLVFSTSNTDRAGADHGSSGALSFRGVNTGSGYDEIGDLELVLDYVDLNVTNGKKLRYDFTYSNDVVRRACPNYYDGTGAGASPEIAVPILQNIQTQQLDENNNWQSIGNPYEFAYYESTLNADVNNSTSINSGYACPSNTLSYLKTVSTPQLAKVEYDYELWPFVAQCSFRNNPDAEIRFNKWGVSKRSVFNYNGQLLKGKTYDSNLYLDDPSDPIEFSGPNCTRETHRITETNTFKNTSGTKQWVKEKFYSATYVGPEVVNVQAPENEWRINDVGLPYTKSISKTVAGTTDNLYLSKEVFRCKVQNNTDDCALDESHWVRYAMQFDRCESITRPLNMPGSCWRKNPVVERSLVVYHDDFKCIPSNSNCTTKLERYKETVNRDYDGLGKFRTVQVWDNFEKDSGGQNPVRKFRYETKTNYNTLPAVSLNAGGLGYFNINASTYAGLPSINQLWNTNIFDSIKERTGGSPQVHYKQYKFDGKGRLECVRIHKNSGSGNYDLVNTKDFAIQVSEFGSVPGEDSGLPITVKKGGGELGNLSENEICAADSQFGGINPDNFIVTRRSYVSSRLSGISVDGLSKAIISVNIDPHTGLPTSETTRSNQSYTFNYDLFSRPISIIPENSLREASTHIVYTDASITNGPSVAVSKGDIYSKLWVNSLGQVWREQENRPTELGISELAERRSSFDKQENLIRQTTWNLAGTTDWSRVSATDFLKFDPQGRPEKTIFPDGSEVLSVYRGERSTKTINSVNTGNDQINVNYHTIKDSIGQVIESRTPQFSTFNGYDPAGNLVSAIRTGGGLEQSRIYNYDARGSMVSARIPEYGMNGFELLNFKPNIQNLPTQLQDGKNKIKVKYDLLGRAVTKTWTHGATGLPKILEEMTFCESQNCFTNTNPNNDDSDIFNEYYGNDYREGQLISHTRHNWKRDRTSNAWVNHPVTARYEYRDGGDQISHSYLELLSTALGQHEFEFLTEHSYDSLRGVKSTLYPEFLNVTQRNRLGVRNSYVNGKLVTQTSLSGTAFNEFNYEYYINGAPSYTQGGQNIIEYGLDPSNMPRTRRITGEFNGDVFDTGDYSYDPSGNISQVGASNYVYDELNRLVDAQFDGLRDQYSYDIFNNITSRTKTESNNVFCWNFELEGSTHNNNHTNNRLLALNEANTNDPCISSLTGTSNSLGKSMYDYLLWVNGSSLGGPYNQYDAAGNLVSVADRWLLGFDAMNMQISFEDTNIAADNEEYYYAPGNYRVATTRGNGLSSTVEIQLRDQAGRKVSTYFLNSTSANPQLFNALTYDNRGYVIQEFQQSHAGNYTATHLSDHLGSIRMSNLGNISNVYTNYRPFGETYETQQQPTGFVSFATLERDWHNRLDYARARTLAFPLGRFASPDPAKDGWNLYAYTGNNPINRFDPTGLTSQSDDQQREPEPGDNDSNPTTQEIEIEEDDLMCKEENEFLHALMDASNEFSDAEQFNVWKTGTALGIGVNTPGRIAKGGTAFTIFDSATDSQFKDGMRDFFRFYAAHKVYNSSSVASTQRKFANKTKTLLKSLTDKFWESIPKVHIDLTGNFEEIHYSCNVPPD